MSEVPRFTLRDDCQIPRMITGTWQVSAGHAVEPLSREDVFSSFAALVDRGFTAFDCADIYTGVESLLGDFLRSRSASVRDTVRIHTKLVPDRDALADVDRAYVERVVERSLRRLGVERLDLVQLAWWDYAVPGYVEAAGFLADLQAAGKIRHVAATNFDVERLEEIISAGIDIVSNQVQYSPLDTRPEHGMVELVRRHGAGLLCYGSLAGGFLSAAYRRLEAPPERPANRSLTKYALIIDEFGGWVLYRELLDALAAVADKHSTTISNVALSWLLSRPGVAAAIVGVSRRDRVARNMEVFSVRLDIDDESRIGAILARRSGPRGAVFGLERESGGRHAAIMRYNLNSEP